MANFGDVKLSDRDLEEYLRQEKLPAELSKKYPNISELIGSENIGKSDMDVIGSLINKVNPSGPITQAKPIQPLELQRKAENAASTAFSKDVAKTTDPNKLIEFLKNRDKVEYDVINSPELEAKGFTGAYFPEENVMGLPKSHPELLDTIIHEHGHARDVQRTGDSGTDMLKAEDVIPTSNKSEINSAEIYNKMLDLSAQNRLDELSKNLSGKHFNEPGSQSLNEFTRAVKEIANKEAANPYYKSKYSNINKLFIK